MKPALASPLRDPDTSIYFNDDSWAMEPKMDGQRMLVHVVDHEAKAYSRKGEELAVPEEFLSLFNHRGFVGEWWLDGEYVNDRYFLFDVPQSPATDASTIWSTRRSVLEQLIDLWKPEGIGLVPAAMTSSQKQDMYQRIVAANMEGVVLKAVNGLYTPGKSLTWLKLKFEETADCFVAEINRKGKEQAVTLGLLHDGEEIEAGGCKVPPHVLQVGDIVEVRYLYASPEHKLFQPVFLRLRTDKRAIECTTDQLKIGGKYL